VHSYVWTHTHTIILSALVQVALLLLLCTLSGYWQYMPPLTALLPLSLLSIVEADMLYQLVKHMCVENKMVGSNASTVAARQGKLALAAAACECTLPILALESGRLWGNVCRSRNCAVAAVTALRAAVSSSSSAGRRCMSGTGCSTGGGLKRTFCRKFEWFCGAMPGAKRHEQQQAAMQFGCYVVAVSAQVAVVYMYSVRDNGWGWLAVVLLVVAAVHAATVTSFSNKALMLCSAYMCTAAAVYCMMYKDNDGASANGTHTAERLYV
jgi:hypothetical protein